MKTKLILLLAFGLTTHGLVSFAQNEKPAAAIESTNAASLAAGEIMPLVTLEEASLPDAIKTLARQANINFQFDPKVLAGRVGTDGKPIPQPQVTVRWENITALQALMAVLDNHDLHLV